MIGPPSDATPPGTEPAGGDDATDRARPAGRGGDDPWDGDPRAADPGGDDRAGELVVVARVVKPHGIRGEVAVDPLTDVPGRFAPGAVVALDAPAGPDAPGERLTITRSRPHQGRLLLGFEEVADRDGAEELRDRTLLAPRVDEQAFPTYFVHELVGAPVELEDGRHVGVVDDVVGMPAAAGYELLEVTRPDGTTVLVPDPDDLVEAVEDDDGLRLVVVDPPEGLLEE